MDIITDKSIKIKGSTAIALGRFDGIHLGHQELISKVISKGEELSLIPAVFTFKNKSSNILKESRLAGSLIDDDRKKEVFRDMGIELLYIIDFNEEIRQMIPEDFVKDVLVDKLNAKVVVVGFNYRFGYKGKGTIETLKKYGEKYGFEVIVIEPVSIEDTVVSSTLIREFLLEGNINKVNKMLGRNYRLKGKVINGKGRGKSLGFATANIELNDFHILPKLGVYKTRTCYGNKVYLSITNIGDNPTFNNDKVTIETHIFDFDQNLYDSTIEVIFDEFMREEIKFNSKKELIHQINKDIKQVKAP